MLKKNIFITTVGAVCIGVSGATFAASFTSWDKAIMPHSAPKKAEQLVDYRYPYIKVGAGAYAVQNPKIEIGTVGDSTAPLASIGNSKVASKLDLAVGYAFYNMSNSLVTRIFGHDNAVELKFGYYSLKQKKYNDNLGTGRVWYIDGSGEVTNAPSILSNFNLNSKHRCIDTGLYYRGKRITSNPRVTFLPRAGIIFTNLNEKYNYSLVYTSVTSATNLENYNVSTDYFGLAAGGKLAYDIKSRCSVFADLEAQLLYVYSNLEAYQDAIVGSAAGKDSVNYHHTKITYRVIAALGSEYKLNDKSTSPSVEIKGGVDRWGYDPKVVPPNHAGDRPIHLAGNSQVNYFAAVGVTVPIG